MAKFARKKRSALSLQSPGSISYSVQMRPNGMNENDPERAYASLQYAGTVKLDQLATHISEHGSPYTRDMIIGVTTAIVDCIREHVTEGYKVEIGDLGTFKLSIKSKGAESVDKFNPASNITDAYVEYEPGGYFVDLVGELQFTQVVNRTIQTAAMKAFKAGKITKEQLEAIRKGEMELGVVEPEEEGGSGG